MRYRKLLFTENSIVEVREDELDLGNIPPGHESEGSLMAAMCDGDITLS